MVMKLAVELSINFILKMEKSVEFNVELFVSTCGNE
jgi:hypothetical protein